MAAISDDIAYNNHDIDDGLRAGLFEIAELAEVPLAGPIFGEVSTVCEGSHGDVLGCTGPFTASPWRRVFVRQPPGTYFIVPSALPCGYSMHPRSDM